MHALFCDNIVEFADNRAYELGFRDAKRATGESFRAMVETARECPLGQNQPRHEIDAYWTGVHYFAKLQAIGG